MHSARLLAVCALNIAVLSACTPGGAVLPAGGATVPPEAPTPAEQAPSATAPDPTALASPTAYSMPEAFPLSEPGTYFASNTSLILVDNSRNGREVRVTLWYPALKETDEEGHLKIRNAAPDRSRAPYPLILTGANSGDLLFRSHPASYGFVMVIVHSPGFSYTAPWNNAVIDAPLDFLFALDVLTSNPPKGLDGILDTDRVGVAGYSSDGLFSLALGGARINPQYYFSQCAQAPNMDPPLNPFWIEYFCSLSEGWGEFSSQVGAGISTVSDGLWQPTTDDRILAVMPMAPDSAWLYGPEGLAAIHVPSMIIAGTADDLVSYEMTSCYVYEHLVNSDRALISFIGKDHMMVEDEEVIRRIDHFAVAFLGYYLQGREDYAKYFSEEFVAHQDGLAWGVYEGE